MFPQLDAAPPPQNHEQEPKQTRDLMRRMGHNSMRAALIYQHLSSDSRVAAGLTDQLANVTDETTARNSNGAGNDGSDAHSARRVQDEDEQ